MFLSAAFVVVCIAVAGCVEDVKSPILFSKFVCALCHGRSLSGKGGGLTAIML